MRKCSVNSQQHNLNIHMYKFSELLELFHLNYNSTIEDLKEARKIVLKMHPDKSRLPGDYFLFYKKAFEIVVDHFKEQQKTSKPVPTEKQLYVPPESKMGEQTDHQISATIKKMNTGDFQKQFNELYEENMTRRPDESRNAWFKSNDPLFEFDGPRSAKDIANSIEQVKAKTAALSVYKGVQEMNSSVGNGSKFYDEDDEDANSEYVSCDPFSKLKFDDLRKVHKDQTVFAVSEADYGKMQHYGSIDQLNQARNAQNLKPIDKQIAEKQMAEKEAFLQQQAAARHHAAQLRSMQYEEKNKAVLANFMRIGN